MARACPRGLTKSVVLDSPGVALTHPSAWLIRCRIWSHHDRMPVILEPPDWPVWLEDVPGDTATLLHPPPADTLRVWPIDRWVREGSPLACVSLHALGGGFELAASATVRRWCAIWQCWWRLTKAPGGWQRATALWLGALTEAMNDQERKGCTIRNCAHVAGQLITGNRCSR